MNQADIITRAVVTSGGGRAPVTTVAILNAAGTIHESRQFGNDWTAVRWANSWGCPVDADTDTLREFVVADLSLSREAGA